MTASSNRLLQSAKEHTHTLPSTTRPYRQTTRPAVIYYCSIVSYGAYPVILRCTAARCWALFCAALLESETRRHSALVGRPTGGAIHAAIHALSAYCECWPATQEGLLSLVQRGNHGDRVLSWASWLNACTKKDERASAFLLTDSCKTNTTNKYSCFSEEHAYSITLPCLCPDSRPPNSD